MKQFSGANNYLRRHSIFCVLAGEMNIPYKMIVFFADNIVSVHDLTTFGLITVLNKTKGASLFAVDVQVTQLK